MKYYELDLQKAIQFYESGMTQDEVAVEMATTQKSIYKLFKKNGYKCRIAAKRDQRGEKNHMWKGNKAGYASLHRRVEISRGKPLKCERCGTTKAKMYNWANLTGKYEDPQDYMRLCRSCHAKLDNHGRFLKHTHFIKRLFVNNRRECPSCGLTKEFDEFGNNKNLPYGKSYWCKNCINDRARKRLKK